MIFESKDIYRAIKNFFSKRQAADNYLWFNKLQRFQELQTRIRNF